jgi:hypothetical protein
VRDQPGHQHVLGGRECWEQMEPEHRPMLGAQRDTALVERPFLSEQAVRTR